MSPLRWAVRFLSSAFNKIAIALSARLSFAFFVTPCLRSKQHIPPRGSSFDASTIIGSGLRREGHWLPAKQLVASSSCPHERRYPFSISASSSVASSLESIALCFRNKALACNVAPNLKPRRCPLHAKLRCFEGERRRTFSRHMRPPYADFAGPLIRAKPATLRSTQSPRSRRFLPSPR